MSLMRGCLLHVLDLKEGNDDDTINASVREGNRTGLAMRRFNGTHGYPPAVSPFGRNVMRRLLSPAPVAERTEARSELRAGDPGR